MYKYISIFIIFTFLGCDDGSFEIPSFEFSDTVQTCGNYVIYRTNTDQTEAFIIQLSDTDIPNEVTSAPIEVPITNSNVQYRIFDGTVGADYFCADVPPVTPQVRKNWQGISGDDNKIIIETTEDTNLNGQLIGYKHQITLHNLVLENDGERQVYETYYFGSFTTAL